MKEGDLPTLAPLTNELMPALSLTHGQALWLMGELGFSSGPDDAAFGHYIKSLRKLGLPFARGEPGLDEGRRAHYAYPQLMELAVALSLRVYHTLPDEIVAGVLAARVRLRGFYRRAYLEHASGIGRPVEIAMPGRAALRVSGAFLDVRVRYAGGHCLAFGPPRLVSPAEALRIFITANDAEVRTSLPFNLSRLAIRLVTLAQQPPQARRAPAVRRGRSV